MFANNRGDEVLPLKIGASSDRASVRSSGAIGIGTWETQAEFKDIKVTSGDKVLYQPDVIAENADWKRDNGTWAVQDGAIAQTSTATGTRISMGDPSWTDYTLTLKAKKLSGKEGFMIYFHTHGDEFVDWNLGGWGNQYTAIQQQVDGSDDEISQHANLVIETGRWYDLKIEVAGNHIRCYADGALISETDERSSKSNSDLFAVSTRDGKTGDVILKLVNTASTPQDIAFDVAGAGTLSGKGVLTQMAGDPSLVNTITEPEKIKPTVTKLTGVGAKFSQQIPAHSVSVIRLLSK
jgi:alpha-L-arabinofuranosidase